MDCLRLADEQQRIMEFRWELYIAHVNETHNKSSRQETVWALEQVPKEILSKIPNANTSTADRVEALERKVTCSTEPGQRKKINSALRGLSGTAVHVERDVYSDRQFWNES